MANVELKYSAKKRECGDSKYACLIVGKSTDLAQVTYASVEKKLSPLVKEELFKEAVSNLGSAKKGSLPLYLQSRTLAVLPSNGSRHNCPFSPHALTQAVKNNLPGYQDECVYVVCERKAVFALGCAIARVFSIYSKKTSCKKEKRTVTVEFHLVGNDQTPLTQCDIDCLTSSAESIRLAARIVDAPCNEMNTDHFLDEIRLVGKDLGIAPFILQGTELRDKGFGGIYGVGKAAINQPALAVLSHKPDGATETIAWCGKGIVYDTGGLSIKGKTAMPGMKRDCGGAAGLLGAFRTAVKMGFKQNLHAVFCLAENAVGPIATRPDDVHELYSGLTVEINNTDAEGRLVLGDGVAYAKKDLGANIVVDMATLTGAQGVSTGLYHAGLLTNNAEWEESCVKAGQRSGDLVHPLPYCPEFHFSEFASAIADMKNSVKDRGNAQSSCAGLFIESHLGKDFKGVWVHIDMAAPAHHGERATGYGVALMLSLFGNQSQCALLQQ